MNPPSASGTHAAARGGLARRLGSFIVGVFTRNLVAKVAALVLAVLVWVTVRRDLLVSETFDVQIEEKIHPALMVLGRSPRIEKVTFYGPTSQINQISRQIAPQVVLQVGEGDLQGQDEATVVFSVEKGNIRHGMGRDVEIVGAEPYPEMRLTLAYRDAKDVRVNQPRRLGNPGEQWEVKVELITPDVRVTGPRATLRELASIDPAPVDIAGIVSRNRGEDVVDLPVKLELSTEDRARHLSLPPGAEMRCRVSVTRSRVERTFDLPFRVLAAEKTDWPVRLVLGETERVKRRDDGGFTIQLTFTGRAEALDRVAEAVEDREVWAFVLAEDFGPYASGEAEATGYLDRVRLELPAALRQSVSFLPPPLEAVEVTTEAR